MATTNSTEEIIVLLADDKDLTISSGTSAVLVIRKRARDTSGGVSVYLCKVPYHPFQHIIN